MFGGIVEPIHQLEIIINLYLQSLGSWPEIPMKIFSLLGQEEFFFLFFPIIYWCVDASLGLQLALLLLSNNVINSSLKLTFHNPRPYWFDTRVKAYISEAAFGLPSSHAQISVGMWGMLSASIKRKLAYYTASFVILMVGLSRIYLGVHFASDVLSGWVIGLIFLIVFLHWGRDITGWFKHLSFSKQLIYSFLSSLLLLLIMLLPALLLKSWQPPKIWIKNSLAAFPDIPFSPTDISIAFNTTGTWLGLLVGAIWVSHQFGGFNASGTEVQKILRFLIGFAGFGILWFGRGSSFPNVSNVMSDILRYFHYGLIGFWISGLAPFLFIKMNLAKSYKGFKALQSRENSIE